MPLQNFVDNSLPTIKAAWLNSIDSFYTTLFGSATTATGARTAIGATSAADTTAAIAAAIGVSVQAYDVDTAKTDVVQTFSAKQTFGSGAVIAGTATNDNAAAGKVGEYVSSSVLAGSAISLANGVSANITSISLTAGDWDVSTVLGVSGAGATLSYTIFGTSQTSATLPTDPDRNGNSPRSDSLSNSNTQIFTGMTTRISLASTATIYLVGNVGFSAAALSGYGTIRARRIR
jgi:hypothetical protein